MNDISTCIRRRDRLQADLQERTIFYITNCQNIVQTVPIDYTHEMPSIANSVTKTPPPVLAKASPKLEYEGLVTTQPSFAFAKVEQSVELMSVLV